MKRRRRKPAQRNPIAKAVRKIRPQAVPDKRRKKLDALKKRETEEGI